MNPDRQPNNPPSPAPPATVGVMPIVDPPAQGSSSTHPETQRPHPSHALGTEDDQDAAREPLHRPPAPPAMGGTVDPHPQGSATRNQAGPSPVPPHPTSTIGREPHTQGSATLNEPGPPTAPLQTTLAGEYEPYAQGTATRDHSGPSPAPLHPVSASGYEPYTQGSATRNQAGSSSTPLHPITTSGPDMGHGSSVYGPYHKPPASVSGGRNGTQPTPIPQNYAPRTRISAERPQFEDMDRNNGAPPLPPLPPLPQDIRTRRSRTRVDLIPTSPGPRSGIDYLVPLDEKASREKTIGERLQPTLLTAISERDKYAWKAKMTGFALNTAIGLQVLLSALTTGLSAATAGQQASVAPVILGGLATLVASYMARARGSNEPELSITRVKDLEQFIRECEAFQMDHGHATGNEFDATLYKLRDRFEELLGNANGERRLAPPV